MKGLALLFVPVLLVLAGDAELDIPREQAQVSFSLSSVLHTVHGAFDLKRGTFRFDPTTGRASGELVVDAASGRSGNTARDRKMHAAILESARYPEIVFRPDRVEGKVAADGPSDAVVHGILSIHGADHEIGVPVHVESAGGRHTAKARFVVPYVLWGMKNPSTFVLRVSEKVEIDVTLVATAVSGALD